MRTSRTHRGSHGHHIGSLLAVAVGLTIVAAGYVPGAGPAEPTGRVEVAVTVPDGTTRLLPAATSSGRPGSEAVGVRVPTHEEIHAQCRAADLVDECRAGGLR